MNREYPLTDHFEREMIWGAGVPYRARSMRKWGTFSDNERDIWRIYCHTLEDDVAMYRAAHKGLYDPPRVSACLDALKREIRILRFWLSVSVSTSLFLFSMATLSMYSGLVMAYVLVGASYAAIRVLFDHERLREMTPEAQIFEIHGNATWKAYPATPAELLRLNAFLSAALWPRKMWQDAKYILES